jgi:hypothetical protein
MEYYNIGISGDVAFDFQFYDDNLCIIKMDMKALC